MNSYRDFVGNDLLDKITEDIKNYRIFNEADLQYRTAHHLDKVCYPEDFLTNQPCISIGRTRGTIVAKPDIVIYDSVNGPTAAFELKCFLKENSAEKITELVWRDVDKLFKFKSKYQNSKNSFSIAVINTDPDTYSDIRSRFSGRNRAPWMSHYLFVHVINIYCDVNGRKRNWYNQWQEEMNHWNVHFG